MNAFKDIPEELIRPKRQRTIRPDGPVFTFIGDFGKESCGYGGYLLNRELRRIVNDPNRYRLNLGSTILTYDTDWLHSHPSEQEKVDALKEMEAENPLQFFMPSQIALGPGDGGVLDFLNDDKTEMKFLRTGNRRGKTASAIADILFDVVPTSKEWPVFKLHRVNHRRFIGRDRPVSIGFASSTWPVVQRVIWPEILRWIPKYELGEYDPREKGHKEVAWRVNPFIKLECGTEFYFFCYEQKQGAFEGQVIYIWYWDEQGKQNLYHGADERLRTVNGRHVFGQTPHKIEGRPDTGARSWTDKLLKGQVNYGHSVKEYTIHPDDVPDWVYPENQKRKAYTKHVVHPVATGDYRALKEGISRFWGLPHDVAGLVYDEWVESIHLVDPFPIPDSWTRYRAVDHGTKNPAACLWLAVSPEGFMYLYREFYRANLSIEEIAAHIITLSGNEREKRGLHRVAGKGIYYERFSEKPTRERYHRSVLDSRSFAATDSATMLDIGTLYKWNGLNCQPASGMDSSVSVPIVKQLLSVDFSRKNPNTRDAGSPTLFVFRDLVNFREEITSYSMQENTSSGDLKRNLPEKPVAKNDHLMNALAYIAQIPPRYIEGKWAYYEARKPSEGDSFRPMTEEEEEEYDRKRELRNPFKRDPITGY